MNRIFLYLHIMNYNNPDLRVLNITHADMDGIASSIVLKNFYKTVYVVPVTYQSESISVHEALNLYKEKFDIIICTDFYPAKTITELQRVSSLVVIDHHESVEDKNNDENIIINTLYSGCELTFNFINKFKDISKLQEFVTLVSDWDMFRLKDKRSAYYNNMYWEMGPKWFLRRFINGNVTLYPEEKQYFVDATKEFKDLYESLEIFDMARNGVFFETARFQYECIEALKKDGYKWFAIRNKNNLSVRCDDVDLVDIAKKLGKGGGHKHAIGIPLTSADNIGELLKKLEYFIDDYYMNMIDD